jgi:hypothetical protein
MLETDAQSRTVRLKAESFLIKLIMGVILLILVIFGVVSLKALY